jgi:hypothetical protein
MAKQKDEAEVEFATVGHLSDGQGHRLGPGTAIPEGFLEPERLERLLERGSVVQRGKADHLPGASSSTTGQSDRTGVLDSKGHPKGGDVQR